MKWNSLGFKFIFLKNLEKGGLFSYMDNINIFENIIISLNWKKTNQIIGWIYWTSLESVESFLNLSHMYVRKIRFKGVIASH